MFFHTFANKTQVNKSDVESAYALCIVKSILTDKGINKKKKKTIPNFSLNIFNYDFSIKCIKLYSKI